ncbi:MAG: ABC transporter ATP-binding protein [Clostridiales bacterium]|nr:ABC transporter ATP-binding protein [Clostridiales bacterium]
MRKAYFLQYLIYGFRWAGLLTTALVGLRVLAALVPTAQLVVLAGFLDAVGAAFAGNRVTMTLWQWLAALLVLQFVGYLINTAASWFAMEHRLKVGAAFEAELLAKHSRLRFDLLEDSGTCDLAEKVAEDAGDKMHRGLLNLLDLGEYALRVLGICGTVLLYSVPVGLAALLLFAVMLPLAVRSGKEDYEAHSGAVAQFRRARYFEKIIADQEHSAERKSFDSTGLFNRKWEGYFGAGRRISHKASRRELTRLAGGNILILLFSCAIAALLLFPLSRGSMTTGAYISVVSATISLAQMISWYIALIVEDFVSNRLYIRDYLRFRELPEIDLDERAEEPRQQVGRIEFRDVSFAYPGTERRVLDHLSLRLEAGRSYAVVGENGAGKSTLIKLLLGLYDGYEGEILVDGENLRALRPAQLRGCFACAFQDYARYEISLSANLAPGREDRLDPAERDAVIDRMGLRPCMDRLPQGLDTELGHTGEQGNDLSGGQWQRVAIARALLRRAPVVIMDEPAAALDPSGEAELYDTLLRGDAGPLRILITHRLGCVRDVDEILVLSGGRVAERGPHEALLAEQGLYAEMFALQRSWYV